MPRPRIDADAQKDRILAAAEQILRRTGKPTLTVQDVADECGMSPANAYRFFRNKEDMIRSLVARWFREIEVELDAVVDTVADPEQALRNYVATQHRLKCARFDADPALFRTYLALADRHRAAVQGHVERIHRQFERLVARFLAAEGLTRTHAVEAARMLQDMTVAYRAPQMIALDRDARTRERLDRILDHAIAALRTHRWDPA